MKMRNKKYISENKDCKDYTEILYLQLLLGDKGIIIKEELNWGNNH